MSLTIKLLTQFYSTVDFPSALWLWILSLYENNYVILWIKTVLLDSLEKFI
jgi:hypothetical protein